MAEILATFNFTDHSTYYSVSIANKAANPTKASIPSTYNSKPVTKIDTSGFQNCTSLRSVEVPATITEIGSNAFSGCSSLASIVMFPTTAPTLGSSAFDGISSAAKFYVFQAALSNYKTNWSTYSDQLVADDLRLYFILNANATKDYVNSAASTGVRSVVESSTDGKIKVNTNGVVADVSIHGWANKLDKMTGTSSFELAYTKTENGGDGSKPISISNTPSSLALRTPTGKLSATTPSANDSSTAVATKGYVDAAIEALPEPMIFKGTVGTGGTVTWANLPAAAAANEGWTYKVITDHATAPICKIGDTIISNGSTWVVIPSGDEPDDTWRNIKVNGTELLGTAISTGAVNFKDGTNVTVAGSGNDITISASNQTVKGNGTAFGASDAVNFVGGTNVTVTPNSTNKTITIASENQTVKAGDTTFGASDAVKFVGGTNVTITPDATAKTITIASSYTDTNQTVKAGDTTFAANDVVSFVGGTNVTITPNSTNKTITITATDKYHTPSYNSGLKVGTGTGVNDLYVPNASTAQAGVVTVDDQEFSGSKSIVTDSSSDKYWEVINSGNTSFRSRLYYAGLNTTDGTYETGTWVEGFYVKKSSENLETDYERTSIKFYDYAQSASDPIVIYSFPDRSSSYEGTTITDTFALRSDIPTVPTGFYIAADASDDMFDIVGTGGTNRVKYAVKPYSATTATSTWVNNTDNEGKFYLGNQNPKKDTRLNYNGHLYAKKLYSEASEVLTSSSDQTIKGLNTFTKVITVQNGSNAYANARYNNTGIQYNKTNAQSYNLAFPEKSGTLAVKSDIPNIPTSNVPNRIFLSTSSLDHPVWSSSASWSGKTGFLKVDANGISSVDETTYLTSSTDLTANEILLGNGAKKVKKSGIGLKNSSYEWDELDDFAVPTEQAISEYVASEYVHKIKTGNVDRAYIVTASNTDSSLEITSASAKANTLAKRDSNGHIKVATPSVSSDAATKGYVDGYHDSTKLDKVTSGSKERAYIITSGNTQSTLEIVSASAAPSTLAKRDDNGRIKVATPNVSSDATTKAYVDAGLNAKLDKISSEDTLERVYSITTLGVQSTTRATNVSMPNTLIKRDANGRAEVAGPPVSGEDIANKNYVDTKVNRSDIDESFFNALF